MTSSFFRRPNTATVRANYGLARPNRAGVSGSSQVSRTQDGRIIDMSNPQQAGKNAGQGFAEISSFLEKTVEVVPPLVKDVMQDAGIKEANALLGDPVFRAKLREGDASTQQLYEDLGNPFARDVIDASLGAGVAAAYNRALPAALYKDDALITPVEGETEEEFRARTRSVRTERETALLDSLGYNSMPQGARNYALPSILSVDKAAQGDVFTKQQERQNELSLQETGRAVQGLLATYDVDLSVLDTAANDPAATQDVRDAALRKRGEAAAAFATDLVTTFTAKNYKPSQARTVLAKEILRLEALGTDAAERQLEVINAALELQDEKGYLLTVGGQAISTLTGPNGGNTLLGMADSALAAVQDKQTRREQQEADVEFGRTAQRVEQLAQAGQIDAAEKELSQLLLRVTPANVKYILPAVNSFLSRIGALETGQQQDLDNVTRGRLLDLKYQHRNGELTKEEYMAKVMQLNDGKVSPELLNAALDDAKGTPGIDKVISDFDTTLQGNQAVQTLALYDHLTGKGVQITQEQASNRLLAKTAELARSYYDAEVAAGRSPAEVTKFIKENGKQFQDDAAAQLMVELGPDGEKPAGLMADKVQQAEADIATIAANLDKGITRGDLPKLLEGTNLEELYRRSKGIKPDKPIYYPGFSNWFVDYLGKLQKSDGKYAFPDPGKTFREGIRTQEQIKAAEQRQQQQESIDKGRLENIEKGQFGGFRGLGMIDPAKYNSASLAILDRGLRIVESMFGGSSQEQPEAQAAATQPAESMAPQAQVMALDALTGPGVDPYPVQQVASTEQSELPRVLYQKNWDAFKRIWGSGTDGQSNGARYTMNTPPTPQVVASKPVPPAPMVMASANHPNAILIGLNEGTRTKNGGFTAAYSGHIDPGNGAGNQGTFSAQQGFASARQADAYWVRKINIATINTFAPALRAAGLQPGTAGYERLLFNLQDLYVQAPAAALNEGGLVSRIPEIIRGGVTIEAIAKARADSFFIPGTTRLAASGFNNDYTTLLLDQRRRSGTWDYKRRIG